MFLLLLNLFIWFLGLYLMILYFSSLFLVYFFNFLRLLGLYLFDRALFFLLLDLDLILRSRICLFRFYHFSGINSDWISYLRFKDFLSWSSYCCLGNFTCHFVSISRRHVSRYNIFGSFLNSINCRYWWFLLDYYFWKFDFWFRFLLILKLFLFHLYLIEKSSNFWLDWNFDIYLFFLLLVWFNLLFFDDLRHDLLWIIYYFF